MSDDTRRLAVLIDADNISPKVAKDVFEELASYGTLTVKRAYGDWTTPQLGGWKTQLNQHAIVPVQQFAYTTGKNSTDSALIIDAMDLLYSGNLDAFALVSSDSDFTRLATRIRESGRTVYGLGLRKTPKSLVAACDTFIYLEVLGKDTDEGDESDETDEVVETDDSGESAPKPRNVQSLLTRALNKLGDDDGWVRLSALGSYLSSADSSFDPRNYGHPKLSALVQDQAFLTTTGSGSGLQVRIKGRTVAKKTAAKTSTAKKSAAKKTAKKAEQPAQPNG